MARSDGFTLLEALLVVSLLLLMGGLALTPALESLARQRVESATRRVLLGLERGRQLAERQGQPCALGFDSAGWGPPRGSTLSGCLEESISLGEGAPEGGGVLKVEHNLADAVRFSANGLVLDGGTVVLSHPATSLVRCVVVSLPLGITRVGMQSNGSCLPDPSL
ncbi:MAG: GspH/FimT family protein [Cyanobium sp.]